MKKLLVPILLILLPLSVFSTDMDFSVSTSTFAFDDDGDLHAWDPSFGGKASITDKLGSRLDGTITFERDAVNGNTLSARGTYRTSFLEISAGPSFGVLNSTEDDDDVSMLFQPGLALGFSVIIPGKLIVRADSDFALPPATYGDGQVYLQRGELSTGFYLPNILCTIKISQRSSVSINDGTTCTKSITDYGVYSEAFSKGAPFRIDVDFIYRVVDYYVMANDPANRKYAHLVLGGGATWAPKTDFNLYIKGAGSLYTFSLLDHVNDLDNFFFDLTVGMRMTVGSPPTLE